MHQEPVPRIALVMGAQHYDLLEPVDNAWNDAAETERVLRSAGFSRIRSVFEPTEGQIYDYVGELAQLTAGSQQPAVVVVFFAGHGFQSGGYHYIVPVDADRALQRSVPVANLVRKIASSGRGGLTIVFVDACRNPVSTDPSAAAPEAATIIPSEGSPLPAVPRGAILALATKFNEPTRSAARVGAANSPYTVALMRYIPRPSLPLPTMLGRVASLVEQLTQSDESPDVVNGADGSGFYFNPTERERDIERDAWRATLDSHEPECVARFLKNHPDSLFVNAARTWLALANPQEATYGGIVCPDD